MDLKRYIHEVLLKEQLRSSITLSDPTKIRMYSDSRFGARLKGSWSGFSNRLVFPTDLDLTVALPSWNPNSVKGWLAFEELSEKPDNTSIGWRVSDGTSTYWWGGTSWDVVTPTDGEWNTEEEVSENLPTFDHTTKQIQLVANLRTTDDSVTPVLKGYRLMMQAQFDYWEDLVLRTVRRKIASSFNFITDFTSEMEADGTVFNYKTEQRWIPEQNIGSGDDADSFQPEIVGVDAVFDHTNDPDHFTDLVDSVDLNTGAVTLTTTITADATLFVRYLVRPRVVISFPSTDHYEVGSTPEIIIEVVTGEGLSIEASKWMADKFRNVTYKMGSPRLFKKVTFNCLVWTGSIVDSMRLTSAVDTFIATNRVVQSLALDIPYTLCEQGAGTYNPTPNPTDMKQSSFQFIIENFYVWPVVTNGYMVQAFNYSFNRRRDVGPTEEYGVIDAPLPSGAIPTLYEKPDVEES